MSTKISFPISELESRIRNIENNGYVQYSSVMEDDMQHIILTNTKPGSVYNGSVVDIYAGETRFSIEYSRQHKG